MMCNFQCQGMLLIRIIVGQRVVVLAAGVCVGGCVCVWGGGVSLSRGGIP